jgi:dienelactone hydrolase
VALKGFLHYDGILKSRRPGLLLIPTAQGYTDFIKKRSMELAELGYIVFVIDMLGSVKGPTDPQAAEEAINNLYEDRSLMRERANEGLSILSRQKNVGVGRLGCVGFDFGGTVAVELARSGAPLACFVSFYGRLDAPPETAAEMNQVRGPILLLQGADDPHIHKDQIMEFQEEMRSAGADWQMNFYGNAVHGFSDPSFGFEIRDGTAYNYKADKRSWEALKVFLREHLR